LPLIKIKNPDIEFWAVGRDPDKKLLEIANQNPAVHITGEVDDIRQYIEDAYIYIVPLRIGGGVRLKITEAMAMAKPVVSTSIGSEGLNVKDKSNILIADTPEDFADCVNRLLSDENECIRLGNSARTLMENEYDWEVVVEKLERSYLNLIDHAK